MVGYELRVTQEDLAETQVHATPRPLYFLLLKVMQTAHTCTIETLV